MACDTSAVRCSSPRKSIWHLQIQKILIRSLKSIIFLIRDTLIRHSAGYGAIAFNCLFQLVIRHAIPKYQFAIANTFWRADGSAIRRGRGSVVGGGGAELGRGRGAGGGADRGLRGGREARLHWLQLGIGFEIEPCEVVSLC